MEGAVSQHAEVTQKAADAAAGISVGFAGVSLAQINEIVGICSGVIAILAGAYSIWANRRKLKNDD